MMKKELFSKHHRQLIIKTKLLLHMKQRGKHFYWILIMTKKTPYKYYKTS